MWKRKVSEANKPLLKDSSAENSLKEVIELLDQFIEEGSNKAKSRQLKENYWTGFAGEKLIILGLAEKLRKLLRQLPQEEWIQDSLADINFFKDCLSNIKAEYTKGLEDNIRVIKGLITVYEHSYPAHLKNIQV